MNVNGINSNAVFNVIVRGAKSAEPPAETPDLACDKITISGKRESTREYYSRLNEQMKAARENAEGAGKAFDILRKCLIIAARIMAGDEVPQKDHNFLIENNSAMYMKAMSLRQYKEDPEKWDSILGDDDETSGTEIEISVPEIEISVPEIQLTIDS